MADYKHQKKGRAPQNVWKLMRNTTEQPWAKAEINRMKKKD